MPDRRHTAYRWCLLISPNLPAGNQGDKHKDSLASAMSAHPAADGAENKKPPSQPAIPTNEADLLQMLLASICRVESPCCKCHPADRLLIQGIQSYEIMLEA